MTSDSELGSSALSFDRSFETKEDLENRSMIITDEMERLKHNLSQFSGLKAQYDEIHLRYRELSKVNIEISSQNAILEERLRKSQGQVENLLSQMKSQESSHSSALLEAKAEIRNLKIELQEKNTKPMLDNYLLKLSKILRQPINSLEKSLEVLSAMDLFDGTKEECSKLRKQLESTRNEKLDLKKCIQELRDRVSHNENANSLLRATIEGLKATVNSKDEEIGRLRESPKIATSAFMAQLASKDAEIKELKGDLKTAKGTQRNLEKLLTDYSFKAKAVADERNLLKTQNKSYESQIQRQKKQIINLEYEIASKDFFYLNNANKKPKHSSKTADNFDLTPILDAFPSDEFQNLYESRNKLAKLLFLQNSLCRELENRLRTTNQSEDPKTKNRMRELQLENEHLKRTLERYRGDSMSMRKMAEIASSI